MFWRKLDAPLTCITQVLSSERALLGEHRDLFKRDLEELGLQVDKLRGTVDSVVDAIRHLGEDAGMLTDDISDLQLA